MKISLLTLFLCLAFMGVNAQSKKNADKISQRKVYTAVEELPEPEGGNEKLAAVLAKKVKVPSTCEVPGRTVISFIVEADGKIDGYQVIRDPCGKKHPLAYAMFKAVKTIKWKPGKMQGKPVAVRYSLPMCISLASDD